jgi:alpha-beta hydrolase superfamily lysophospholipase
MRARLPDADGFVERDGVRVFYEVFGDGNPTILLMPAWSITHSRIWKMQVPFLARHYRVITFDGRGNGRSDRPSGADSYLSAEYAADALAVMDATTMPATGSGITKGSLNSSFPRYSPNRIRPSPWKTASRGPLRPHPGHS